MLLLLLVLLITAGPVAADETTVSTDPERSAVIIDGRRSGSTSRSGQPCLEYVMTPREEGVLPADSIVAIPCRGTGIRRVTRALREQVVRYLPPLAPEMAPSQNALVHVPQIFWSNQHPVRFDVTVLGRAISVVMVPQFQWHFGDGGSKATSRAGSPYPSRDLTHTYRRACRCQITVVTTWSGRWSDGSGWYPLTSVLTQRASMLLDVRRAPIRLVE